MNGILKTILFVIFHFNRLASFRLILWIEVLLCIEFLDLSLDLLFLFFGFILLIVSFPSFLLDLLKALFSDSFVSSLNRIELGFCWWSCSINHLCLPFFLHDSILYDLESLSLILDQLQMLFVLIQLPVKLKLFDLGCLVSSY